MHKAQRLINHVALVLDASWSMRGKKDALVKVTDEQIKHLALRSEELSQETRVSVYRFGDSTIECLIFDMDVMRLPGTADLYNVLYENTALIDATMKSQKDLETTSQLYGDHAFLTFVLTDGQENRSKKYSTRDLQKQIVRSDVNWSLGFLVPDEQGVRYMERLGVLKDSIATWDVNSSTGLDLAASAIRTATDNFMTARATGVRGTKSVFSTGVDAVNKTTVTQNLSELSSSDFQIYSVGSRTQMKSFMESAGMRYAKGKGYYQLTKTEAIQPSKQIIVVDKKTGKAYSGSKARDLIGLPTTNESVKVRPEYNPDYNIFVQSTAPNRVLLPKTSVILTN